MWNFKYNIEHLFRVCEHYNAYWYIHYQLKVVSDYGCMIKSCRESKQFAGNYQSNNPYWLPRKMGENAAIITLARQQYYLSFLATVVSIHSKRRIRTHSNMYTTVIKFAEFLSIRISLFRAIILLLDYLTSSINRTAYVESWMTKLQIRSSCRAKLVELWLERYYF